MFGIDGRSDTDPYRRVVNNEYNEKKYHQSLLIYSCLQHANQPNNKCWAGLLNAGRFVLHPAICAQPNGGKLVLLVIQMGSNMYGAEKNFAEKTFKYRRARTTSSCLHCPNRLSRTLFPQQLKLSNFTFFCNIPHPCEYSMSISVLSFWKSALFHLINCLIFHIFYRF